MNHAENASVISDVELNLQFGYKQTGETNRRFCISILRISERCVGESYVNNCGLTADSPT